MTIIEGTLVMMHWSSLSSSVGLVDCVRVLLLQRHVVLLTWQPLWVRILAVRTHILIVLSPTLVRIVRLFLKSRPPLLAY